MEWHSRFHDIFFETWEKNGLPHHPDFVNEYIHIREHGHFSYDRMQSLPEISPGINSTQLRSVYGFGATIGKIVANMFALNEEETRKSTDWCGRFNLGISLFDYICDEMNGLASVSSLEVFKPFINSTYFIDRSLTPAEELLSNLTGSVLNDLKRVVAKGSKVNKNKRLFTAMKRMFEAENFISNENIAASADLRKIEKALYYKSAEPFRVMTEFTILTDDVNDKTVIRNALSTGKALGYCYWVIDDAKDVWDDLKSGRWNLFFTLAALAEPKIFLKNQNATLEGDLVKIWNQSKHAEKISRQTIKRLANSVERLDLPDKVKHHSLGLIWASLWQWSKY